MCSKFRFRHTPHNTNCYKFSRNSCHEPHREYKLRWGVDCNMNQQKIQNTHAKHSAQINTYIILHFILNEVKGIFEHFFVRPLSTTRAFEHCLENCNWRFCSSQKSEQVKMGAFTLSVWEIAFENWKTSKIFSQYGRKWMHMMMWSAVNVMYRVQFCQLHAIPEPYRCIVLVNLNVFFWRIKTTPPKSNFMQYKI